MTDLRRRAQDLMQRGRTDEALGLWERALAQSPNDARTWSDVGWALYDLGRHEEALTHLRRALELDSARHEAWICIGMIQTDPEQAIGCYDRALAIDSSLGTAWFLRSCALKELGRTREAEECLERAKALDPRMFASH